MANGKIVWLRWQSGGFLPGRPGFESRHFWYQWDRSQKSNFLYYSRDLWSQPNVNAFGPSMLNWCLDRTYDWISVYMGSDIADVCGERSLPMVIIHNTHGRIGSHVVCCRGPKSQILIITALTGTMSWRDRL